MAIEERYKDRILGFDLLERLSQPSLDALLERCGTVLHFAPGELIYSQGQEDNFINYLLEGRVERTRNGVFELVIDYEKERRTRPLDAMAQKRHTVHAATPVVILRLNRRELERAYLDASPDDASAVLEMNEIGTDTVQDWRTRLLNSALFSRLAPSNIQSIFDRMVEVRADKGQVILDHGEPDGDYYVIQSGSCEVIHQVADQDGQVRRANLGPGDGFGEEAAIAESMRHASVRMTSDGRLMRLAKADFLELVVRPLVRGVSHREAMYLKDEGFVLVDVRAPEKYQLGTLEGAINVPGPTVREQTRDLNKDDSYIICHDDVGLATLGAFQFLERGLDAVYLQEPVSRHVTSVSRHAAAARVSSAQAGAAAGLSQPEDESMSSPTDSNGAGAAAATESHPEPQSSVAAGERVPREDFTDTITGQELADIIDELYQQRKEIESSDSFALSNASGAQSAPLVERVANEASAAIVTPETLVREIIHDIDVKLSQYIKQCITTHQEALTQNLRTHAAQIERVAQEKMKEHSEQMRAQLEEIYAAKERRLKEDYDRLTGLANRLAQQKAQIQQTRKTLTEMLQTANRVNQAVYRAGNELVQQVDHLGQIDDDSNVH